MDRPRRRRRLNFTPETLIRDLITSHNRPTVQWHNGFTAHYKQIGVSLGLGQQTFNLCALGNHHLSKFSTTRLFLEAHRGSQAITTLQALQRFENI